MPRGNGTGPYGNSQGRGRTQGGGLGGGQDGQCSCPNCGHTQPHQLGIPCYTQKCPKCGAPMTRA